MTIHDWTRVSAGTFHAFHNAWISHLQEALNGGILREGYYALGEQRAGNIGPDLLALHADFEPGEPPPSWQVEETGLVAVADHPPETSLSFEVSSDAAFYLTKRRSMVIYHASGDRIVALIEIVSPANKHSRGTLEDFLDTATAAIRHGYHLLVVDLFPPTRHDPEGMHGRIWEYLANESWEPPAGQPLTLASYQAKRPVVAYVEPLAVGQALPDMPLFLLPDQYVNVPLESTYMAAWRGVPERWRRVIEPPAPITP
jgi:hypothetical protein